MIIVHSPAALILCVIIMSASAASQPHSAIPNDSTWVDTLQTLGDYVREHLDEMVPEGFKRQQRTRRAFQQRGYVDALVNVVGGDGYLALVSYLTTLLHIEISMGHRVYWMVPPDPRSGLPGIPFPEDRSFPVDPWKDAHRWK